ncbi:MAG: YlxR family protein [Lachnospiraceae bacterium]|nr:YlxR family protein [Lachnospiraceae bacterium]
MTKQVQPPKKKVPMRTCVGCRTEQPKKELMRIVRTEEGTLIYDPTGRAHGRGAYLCKKKECLDVACKNHGLERAFSAPVSKEALMQLSVSVFGEPKE